MRKHTLGIMLLSIILFANITFAQWSTSGANIYNTNTGYVGIGTSSPTALLHVETPANSAGYIVMTKAGRGTTVKIGDGGSQVDHGLIQMYKVGVENIRFNVGGNSWINGGNVGIGTATPPAGYKLAVVGKIIAEELQVEAVATWPDFVFAPGYNLKPLPDVELYIITNGRLPELPSAQDVKVNGIALGENQALLLQKIEELTLYMIALSKENQALKARVDGLER